MLSSDTTGELIIAANKLLKTAVRIKEHVIGVQSLTVTNVKNGHSGNIRLHFSI